jgi:hypothetical protein
MAGIGVMNRYDVGFTHRKPSLTEPELAERLTSMSIISGRSISGVERRKFLLAQNIGGVRP